MGERILIGVAEPGGAYTAYYRQWGDHPVRFVPELRRQRRDENAGDTQAMAAAIYHLADISDEPLEHSHVNEAAQWDMVWLYLIHVDADAVEAYAARPIDRQGMFCRWELYSRHRLTAGDDDLFALDGTTVRCTNCGAVDDVDFTTTVSATAAGQDTTISCRRCGATETTDPAFTVHRQPTT
ncbi:hypothetical protein [Actinoplanes sp. ATCC 53533]|uniref:hypothetical protein n=1 Tax=Actinoplanes sp. ATCC 53533 TaxID=1288362 RepID=UPI001315160A|nr:hypothetical protein [Actinoplanes sp. ATCC 53533]